MDNKGENLFSNALYVLSALSFLGGSILCIKLWPGDPGIGKEWLPIAFIPAITWFSVGLVEAVIFSSFGYGLALLKIIATSSTRTSSDGAWGGLINKVSEQPER